MKLDYIYDIDIDYQNNPFELNKASYDKVRKELVLIFIFKKPLSLKHYNLFKTAVSKNFKDDNIKLNIEIKYENNVINEENLREYLGDIVNYLASNMPRFKCLINNKPKYQDYTFTYVIENDAVGLSSLALDIEEEFKHYGLNITVDFEQDPNKSIASEIEELELAQREELKKMNDEAKMLQENQKALNDSKNYKAYNVTNVTPIKDIPLTSNDLAIYANTKGMTMFLIEGYIFQIEVKTFTNSNLAQIKMTDETDSIIVKKWLRGDKEIEVYQNLKPNYMLRVLGKAEYDPYARNVIIMASKIDLLGPKKEDEVSDDAKVKRVELHAHSKMSALDSIASVQDYYDILSKWEHKALAICDHDGVYHIPEVAKIMANYNIKPIFGVELNYINDDDLVIAFNQKSIDLKETTYVIFDLETTGLSQDNDRIIEIAATKYNMHGEIDSYETFVNPGFLISDKIVELTSITNEMVSEAPDINTVMPEFLKFIEGSILVAHNAGFDVGMIKANLKRLNYEDIDFPVIDTLNLFRSLHHDDVKRFNLEELAKYYSVKQLKHHRAIDDTRVTAECFTLMLQEIFAKGVYDYKDINNLVSPNLYKYLIPNHINILVKNQVGLKNLYKLLSDAMTIHCAEEPRLLKSVLDKYRDGILVGSGCVNGEVFEEALNGSSKRLEELITYYDYIEVQPPTTYAQLFTDITGGKDSVINTIKKILSAASSQGKIVVATSDCHYIMPYDKKYRDILIDCPQIGGKYHRLKRYSDSPDMHLRTTNEMLNEFSFLNEDEAYQIVVTNTNLIADMIENVRPFPKEMFAPHDDEFKDSLNIPSINAELNRIVAENVKEKYGDNPHQIVKKRLDRELNSIISNGYSSVYYMSHLLVTKSLSDGYLVGSRGSVGSSLVATMMKITEINPLSPHYRCPKCKFQVFKMNEDEINEYGLTDAEKEFEDVLQKVESGYDLPDAVCPICGEKLIKDGHDIPFETFLGFNGDKVPDIDLNFSGDYQSKAHQFVREFMGMENSFRGGTIAKVQEKNAFGYVKGYCERNHINLRSCEIDRIATKIVSVRRSTGQHPGGIVVVPHYVDIYDVTPVQYPADNTSNEWRTTHYDYHSFENNLLKLDILGHDDPTIIKYLMDYVHEHQDKYPFTKPEDIPVDDKNVYRLFSSTDVIGLKPEDIDSTVASYAVPELGTTFVRKLLADTMPKTFAELVKISGLSHGTGIWAGNSQELVLGKTEYGKIPFSDVIGCRDDIMVYLLYQNLEPIKAFEIMEFVRKGKVKKDPEKWTKYKAYMQEKNVPAWYIWSCEQIQYMFPKAHATAYILMALRIAWFKVYSPELFYSAWFTARAKAYSIKAFMGGKLAIKAMISELNNKLDKTAKDDDLINALYVALEMVSRGIKFLPLDIKLSEAKEFKIEKEGLRIPFAAVDGLGESVAFDIVNKRNEEPFTSKKDVLRRTKLNQTIFHDFELMHAFGDLPEEDPIEEYGLFAN